MEEKKDEFEKEPQQNSEVSDTNKYETVKEAQQIAWLSYIGILVIVPILLHPDNEFVKFHARQGIVLLGLEIGWSIIKFILSMLPVIRYLAGFLSFFIWLGFVALSIIGIINAAQGEWKKVPIIGELADSLNII